MRKIFLFTFWFLSAYVSFAGHRAGGEYYWECINDSTYIITYVARVDCAHNYDDQTKYCLVGSLAGDPNNGTYTVDSTYNTDFVVPFCATLPTCQNGGFYNWQSVNVYTDTIVLQQPISPWYTIQHCDGGNRPNADNTNGGWYVEANFSIVVPCNSSPVATSYHDAIFCIGDSAVIQNDFVDPDGDSLVFYLTNCLDGPGQSLNYTAPFTPTNPLTSSTGWTIDSVGNISFFPTIILHGTVCLMIEEWRNGVLISNNIQDMYINFIDCQYSLPADTPTINDIVVVDEGCSGMIYTSGYNESSIVYNSIFPGLAGTYNGYLNCTSGCDTTYVSAQIGYPPFIDFQVCGVPSSGCDIVSVVCDTVRVYFYSSLDVQINPQDPAICFGTGSTVITASGTGGLGPYTYLWNTGATTTNLTVTTGGWYYVTITDQSDVPCNTNTDSVFVDVFTLPILANAGPDIVACEGDTISLSGSVQIATGGFWSGGNGAYIPNDSTLITSYVPTLLEIANGSVELYLTTTGNSTCPPDVDTILISFIKFDASITAVPTTVSCFGGNDGSATISLTGGTSPFVITWNTTPVQIGNTATGLLAGIYTVNLSDGNGCDTLVSVTVPEPPILIAVISDSTTVSCTGGNNGTATVSASGGTAPYSYLWDVNTGNQTDTTAIGLATGIYSVIISDNNGCQDSTMVNIIEPTTAISLTISTTDVNCFGGNDGTATATPLGGTPPYSYLWTPTNQITSTATNLPIGSYTVTVTDTNGCLTQPGIIINEPLPLSASIMFTPVSCFGGNDGTATVTGIGGMLSYTYLWDANAGNQTTSTATGLIAGTYSVTTTDTNGCTFDTSIVVTQPLLPIVLSTAVTPVSCFGGNNGTATVTPSGGTSPYTYLWDANAANQTTATATGLIAGNYNVIVTDTNGCIDSAIVTITQPLAPLSSLTTYTPVSCFGGNDGTATVTPSGGTSPYTYLWDASTGNQTTSTATGLIVGTFNVTITDTNGCFFDTLVVVTQPLLPISLSTGTTPVSCFGGNAGTATVTPSGGTSPYTYLWDANAANQTTAIATGLIIGAYTVIVTDTNGCQDSAIVNVTQPLLPIALSTTSTPVSCFGGNDGTATVLATGGTAPYSYLWDASTGNQTTITATGLVADTFNVTITDTNGCTFDTLVVINQPLLPISFLTSFTPVSCFGGNNGTATVIPSGGTSPYTYLWDLTAASQTTDSASGLTAGNYTVIVTDTNGCQDSIIVTVTEPPILTAVISDSTNVSCTGGNDGTATVLAIGGTAPYTYLWDANAGNQTDTTAIGLAIGMYNVVVTDANGCFSNVWVTITQPISSISLAITTTDVSCFGGNDGTATATPSGGTPPYAYLWSANTGNQTTSTATNLPIGVYSVTVTDTNGCIIQPGIIINEPLPLSASITSSPISCFGGNNGTTTVTPIDGTSPYTYLWDANAGNQTTSVATGLIAGTYNVTTTDTNGCTFDTLVVVTQPLLPISLSTGATSVSCFGGNNGAATVTPSGGTSPYTYLWDANAANQNTATATGLIAGNYTVLITDTNGCIDSAIVTITQPLAPLTSLTSFTAVTCFGGNDGTATVTPSGGTSPYTYLWDAIAGNQITPTATGLIAGSYKVFVTDTNGCQDTAVVIITEPNLITIIATPDDTICPLANATAGVTVNGGNGGYIYNWNMGLPNTQTNTVSPSTTTTYVISVVDTFGCTGNVDSVTIYILNLFPDSINAISSGDMCVGGTTQISGMYSAGFGNYTFSWNQGLGGGLGPFTVSPSTTTTYIFTVTDQCNNSVLDSVVVNVFPLPIISLSPVISEGCEPLLVNFTDTINDTTTVTYLWNFGDGYTSTYASSNHVFADAGIYNVTLTITSAGGCISTSSGNNVVIVHPSPIASSTASPFITDTENPIINFTDLSSGGISVVWDFGDGDTSIVSNPSHTYQDTGIYTVTVTVVNQYGCTDVHQIQIVIEPFFTFQVPNAFTPNPNGSNGGAYDIHSLLNDVFHPYTEFVEEFHMMIFNRWGELIFESFDLDVGWDGYYKGTLSQQDVYVWKVQLTYINGERLTKAGDLTLIR